MTKLLHIAAALRIPHEFVTKRAGLLGQSGSGKTTTASSLVEELLKSGLPTVIVDPTDAWWGLRSSKDGKSDGYPITVLGGDHGDLPLGESAGKVIADLVAEDAPPLVLCVAGFSNAGARRFVADFAERLFERNRTALHVVIDEADEFAPQRIPRGGERCYGAVDHLVRRGRIRGIGVTMICQRSAAIAKDILSQCDTLIAHRTSHPRDLEPLLDWMKVHATRVQLAEVEASIAKLADGEAWVMSPQFLSYFGRVQMRDRETFNSSATPKPGERRVEPKRLAPVDLDVLKGKMAATIERAAADDPKALRRHIAELEAQLRQAPAAAPPKVERVEVPVLRDSQIDAIEKLRARTEKTADLLLTAAVELGLMAKPVLQARQRAPEVSLRPDVLLPSKLPTAARRAGSADAGVGNSGLRRMLIALAQRPQGLTNKQLGVRAGVSSRSGTFSTYLGRARSQGWVAGRGLLTITPAGIAALGSYAPLPEGRALADYWMQELGGGAARMLRVLVDAAPAGLTNEALGEAARISSRSGTFSTYLGRLRSLELVEGRGELRAATELLE